MQQEITIVEIDWTETIGTVTSIGSPYLFGWLRAYYVQPGMIADGQVVVVAREDQSDDWTQYQGPVSLPDADTFVSAFAVMGIPEQAPRVESVPDSSDTLFTGSVRVVVGQQMQTFTVQTQSSGFRGDDADGLRAVFQRILNLSNYGQQQTIFGGSGETKG
jgi:hypothetical protein